MTVIPDDLARRLDAAVDADELVRACQRLVRIPSLSRQEEAVAKEFAAILGELGFDEVELDRHHNVVGRLAGSGSGPCLMVNGHLDHVPPGAMADPYSAAIVDGARWGEPGPAIYGRGTCDMKCNVAAAAFAVGVLRRAGIALRGDIVLVADIAEEIDSPDGVKSVIESGVTADYGLSVEATRLGVYLGHRGKVEYELTVAGRTSHSSEPSRGVNAIYLAQPLIAALREHAASLPEDPVMGGATLAVTQIASSPSGGVPVVPDRCVVRVDRRYLPGETPDQVSLELEALVSRLAREVDGFACDVSLVNHYPLMHIPPDHALVAAARAARRLVRDDDPAPAAWRFGVNGTFMAAAGIPTVGLGPGDEAYAHTPEEHVPIGDLVEAVRIYVRFYGLVCGTVDGERSAL